MTISQTSFLYNRKTWQFAKEQKSNWLFQYPLYVAFPDQELLSFDKVSMKEKSICNLMTRHDSQSLKAMTQSAQETHCTSFLSFLSCKPETLKAGAEYNQAYLQLKLYFRGSITILLTQMIYFNPTMLSNYPTRNLKKQKYLLPSFLIRK